jgi:hypothetical protein
MPTTSSPSVRTAASAASRPRHAAAVCGGRRSRRMPRFRLLGFEAGQEVGMPNWNWSSVEMRASSSTRPGRPEPGLAGWRPGEVAQGSPTLEWRGVAGCSAHPWRPPTPTDEPADGGPQPVGQRSAAGEDNRADPPVVVAVAVGLGAGVGQRTPGLMDGGELGGRVWRGVGVGVQAPGGRPVGAAKLGGRRAGLDAEDLVGGGYARLGWPARWVVVT